jgi:ribosomal protein S18 acetylase RimI-like enzyme
VASRTELRDVQIDISKLERDELADALALQKMAFVTEALLYQNHRLPPLEERFTDIDLEFDRKVFLKARLEESLVGVVRGFVDGGTGFIERLAVHPGFRGRGIGSSLVRALEAALNCSRFELFTGTRSTDNIRLYEHLGYRRFEKRPLDARVRLVLMEKHESHSNRF